MIARCYPKLEAPCYTTKYANCYAITPMKCIGQIRRERLHELQRSHGMTLAELNEKLGRDRRDATLSQVLNAAPITRTGRVRVMGSEQARSIEAAFGLDEGWLDTDPDFDRLQQRTNQDVKPAENPPAWPFRRIPPDTLLSIPQDELVRLEDYLIGFVSGLRFNRQDVHKNQPA